MASPEQPLPSTRRVVTAHNEDAKAIIWKDGPVHGTRAPHGPWLYPIWNTDTLPPDVNVKEDRSLVKTGLANNGVVIRHVDFPPRSVGTVHRTITLDYIVVLKGEVVLVLDDGSRTLLKEGDSCVQQATMHSWDNESDDWCRLLCILIHSANPIVNGQTLQSNAHG